MKKKKVIILSIIIIIILLIMCIMFKNRKSKYKHIEYVPQEELSKEQERNTIISLYFKDKKTGELMPEARIIDAKKLLDNPYIAIIELLIQGPLNDKLEKVIPDDTKINSVVLKGNVLYVDFSKEFIENNKEGIEEESKIIYSLVNSLTELNEVSYVRILIDGGENKSFTDNAINFRENFARND